MKATPNTPPPPIANPRANAAEMRAAGEAATVGPWYVDAASRHANVRGIPQNTTYDHRGDAVASTGDSSFGAMPEADAEFVALARNNWDRLMAAWDFAVAFARTAGDSPECACVACVAARAVGNTNHVRGAGAVDWSSDYNEVPG